MHIAQVSATFPPYMGGTGNVCFQISRELARRDHRVAVFTTAYSGEPNIEDQEGVSVHRFSPWFKFGNAKFLPKLIGINGFDLLHLHYPFFGGEFSGIAAWINHCPLVITYHHDVILQGWKSWVEKLLRWTIERWILRSADIFLFTSMDYFQMSHIRPIIQGLEDRIDFVPNGVDVDLFYPSEIHPINELGGDFCIGDSLVLLVANLDQAHYFKGVGVFLEAFKYLPNSIKGLLIGDGDLLQYYQFLSKEFNIESRISFVGQISESELPIYYRLADVTVLPSVTMGEAFGLVLLESMACSTPVVASNLPGVRTVVNNTQDGYLVEPGNAVDLARKILLLIENPERREEMGRQGRIKVESQYSWSRVVDRLENIYSSLIQKNLGSDSSSVRI